MHEISRAADGQLGQPAMAPVEIGRGYQGTVELDPVSGIVCKQFYLPDKGEAAELARRELDYLRRFSAALAGQPFLRCPEPVRAEPEQGKVWMTYCPGSRLDHMLRTSPANIEADLEHIARQIAIALETYVTEFKQSYHDMGAWNMLYDIPARTLSLIDFANDSEHRPHQFVTGHPPLDVTLGRVIGGSVYDTARPAKWRNHTYWKRQQRLFTTLLDRLLDQHDLDLPLVRNASQAAYDSMTRKGTPVRRLWYSTAGQVRFNRRNNTIFGLAPTGSSQGGTHA